MKPLDCAAQRIEDLRTRFAIKGVLDIECGRGSLPQLAIHNDHAAATLYLHGAHLTHFRPKGRGPVLWMSDWSWFESGKPIRGGVPICWPWFGSHASDPALPGHGLARLVEWRLIEASQQPDGGTRVQLALAPSDIQISPVAALLAAFPHAFELTFTVTVGPRLEMALAVRNTGTETFHFEEALHTYLITDDVRKVRVHGLGGMKYVDKLRAMKVCTQEDEELAFTAETDRVYLDARGPCELIDPVLERRITVTKTHSGSTVVWNPHKAKSKAMPDFGDKEWCGMVCIESANVGANAVTLPAGETHCMEAVLELR